MYRIILTASISFVLVALTGCGKPAASDAEINAMCRNLTRVRGEVRVPTRVELTADINDDFAMQQKDYSTLKARDQKGWDVEYAEALKALAKNPVLRDYNGMPVSHATLEKRYEEKKANSAKKFDDDLLKLKQEKKTRLAGIDDVIAKKQKEFDAKTNACVTKARSQQISQQLAQCRIAAPDEDTYWNKCKDY